MKTPLLDEDIRLFVQTQLRTHPKLKCWPATIRDKTLEALSTKAEGMFQWVVCQIDTLQRLKGDQNIITKALASLPRTLDETYERIFLQIPDEAWPVVYDTLRWIYVHNELRHDNIPLSNLIQAVQRITGGGHWSGYEYDYNEGVLREFCGCMILVSPQDRWCESLVDLQPTTGVSIAHYTFLDFLKSPRIRNGPAAFFAIDKEMARLEFARMVMLEALRTKSNQLWDPEPGGSNKTIADAIIEDFNLFSIASSIFIVSLWGHMISRDAAVSKLAFAMFDATNQHFADFEMAAMRMDGATAIFSDSDLSTSQHFWTFTWTQPPANSNIRTLFNLLTMDESSKLGLTFIQSVHPEDCLRSNISLEFENLNLEGGKYVSWYSFTGTVVEFFAQAVLESPEPLRVFLDHTVGFFDPSRVLLLLVRWHSHDDRDHDCEDDCVLARLLQLGADPNGHGYRICPLQIAAGAWDFEGVKVLLEAGADPNYTGDQEGFVWEDSTLAALLTAPRIAVRST